MIPLGFSYAGLSAVHLQGERTTLGLVAERRRPVRFRARVVGEAFSLRLALAALGAVLWADDSFEAWGAADFALTEVRLGTDAEVVLPCR